MASSTASLSLYPPSKDLKGDYGDQFFDLASLHKEAKVPKQFIWPSEDLVKTSEEELDVPLIDIGAIKGDEAALAAAAELVRKACTKHGYFEVTNHGVDSNLIAAALQEMDTIFNLPLSDKVNARNNAWGHSVAHAERFSTNLPWKETFTFPYKHINEYESQVVDFFKSLLGEDLQHTGLVYQKYCEAMKELSGVILELLAISLGVDRLHYQRFFEDAESIMRCNFYPPCSNSSIGALGIGPHCDPTSITILLQDQVGGLEIYVDNKWFAVHPRPNTFVINIGDTFMALTNGIYKSCLHRALVNKEVERKSLTFFLCPRGDKTVRPPDNLLGTEEARNYPDFAWSQLYEFTQKYCRVGPKTLDGFISWRGSSKPSNF